MKTFRGAMHDSTVRKIHTRSFASAYFTREELEKRLGYPPATWSLIAIKELLDNSLDAVEASGDSVLVPDLLVTIEANSMRANQHRGTAA